MSSCCDNGQVSRPPGRGVCPANGRSYGSVGRKALFHHVLEPWRRAVASKAWYFCDDPDCDVVYFSEDREMLRRGDLRAEVGQKSRRPGRPVCYCFGLSAGAIVEDRTGEARQFILEQTRCGLCACEVRNPSGRCCLKDF